ncbi:hypothetical protein CO157_03145, partial [Candidatus Peregrinibacteria bacterium CG_4_9_14_3_um_filter_49_12]
KAWDAITYLPRKHPVITALLALAGAAWGIYALWDYLGEIIIVPNPIEGAGEVAETVVAPTGGEFSAIAEGEIAGPNLGTGVPSAQPPVPSPNVPAPNSGIFASPAAPPPNAPMPPPASPPIKNPDLFYPDGPG